MNFTESSVQLRIVSVHFKAIMLHKEIWLKASPAVTIFDRIVYLTLSPGMALIHPIFFVTKAAINFRDSR